MVGEVFGRWTVKSDAIIKQKTSGRTYKLVTCECSCGTVRDVEFYNLVAGLSKSCGCSREKGRVTHGGSQLPEYQPWLSMIQRCENPNNPSFRLYGARDIRVVESWRKFENFYADMGPRPSPRHSIDRIDNDGNYEPGNCRWATRTEQSRNRRNNRVIEYGGQKKCLAEWNSESCLGGDILKHRINAGWSIEDAIKTPVAPYHKGCPRLIEYEGGLYTLSDLSIKCGVNRRTLASRLRRGWSVDEATK